MLLGLLARRIRDEPTLRLIALILGLPRDGAAANGIPIGNLTSQFFANVYLDGFDHFVKESLRCRRYLRYVDDFVLLHDDKRLLHEARRAVEAQLAGLGLKLPADQTQVFPVAQGVDFLGFKVFPTHCLLRRSSLRHFRGRLKAMQSERRAGRLSWEGILRSIRGWIAHVSWGDTWGLRAKLLGESTF